jgi:acyl-coenzyme A synthetase/AMP-(fatty) acid ligase
MFLDLEKKNREKVAVIDDSKAVMTFGEICDYVDDFNKRLPGRTLTFILAENSMGSLLGYLSMLSNRIVPLILSRNTDKTLYENLYETYQPAYLWAPKEISEQLDGDVLWESWNYVLIKTGLTAPALYEDLSFLLPTSGSTGSPKLVRHTYRNIEANARNVSLMFKMTGDERAMASLPMHYTMGLSVIASHLYAGATVVLSNRSLMDMSFWKTMQEEKITSFTGVPFSYEIMHKLRIFRRMDFPDLRIITQGGGKLSEDIFRECCEYAERTGKQFIPTYGQSECTARMAFLEPEMASKKQGSIGKAEPNGQLSIIDDNGNETYEGEATGEMVYRGENVTMGYAYCKEDFLKGDENFGVMHTGDIAHRDADGYYFIVGRMKRFLKIFGLRIGLDEVENLVKTNFDTDCLCTGTDEMLTIHVTNKSIMDQVPEFIGKTTHLFKKNIEVVYIPEIKRNEAGKVILY